MSTTTNKKPWSIPWARARARRMALVAINPPVARKHVDRGDADTEDGFADFIGPIYGGAAAASEIAALRTDVTAVRELPWDDSAASARLEAIVTSRFDAEPLLLAEIHGGFSEATFRAFLAPLLTADECEREAEGVSRAAWWSPKTDVTADPHPFADSGALSAVAALPPGHGRWVERSDSGTWGLGETVPLLPDRLMPNPAEVARLRERVAELEADRTGVQEVCDAWRAIAEDNAIKLAAPLAASHDVRLCFSPVDRLRIAMGGDLALTVRAEKGIEALRVNIDGAKIVADACGVAR